MAPTSRTEIAVDVLLKRDDIKPKLLVYYSALYGL